MFFENNGIEVKITRTYYTSIEVYFRLHSLPEVLKCFPNIQWTEAPEKCENLPTTYT